MLFFFSLRTLVDTFFWLTTILSLQKCQNCVQRLQGNTLIKIFFEKHFLFPDRELFLFWLLAKHLQRVCPNCFLRVHKTFWICGFFQFLFLVRIQILSKLFSDIRHEFFRKVVKTAFSMFRRTLWWKVFFGKFFNSSSDSERNNFYSSVKKSQKGSQ